MNQENTNESLSKTAVMQSLIVEELLQKIKFVLECKNEAQAERIIEQFVYYQEEKTIDFANWFLNNCFDSSGKYLNKTDCELLEIFNLKRSETDRHLARLVINTN